MYGLALETEFAYRHNGLDHDTFHGDATDLDGSLDTYTLLANVYYRLNTGTAFTPYIGGGVGISMLDLDMKRGSDSWFHAWIPTPSSRIRRSAVLRTRWRGIGALAWSIGISDAGPQLHRPRGRHP